MTMKVIARPAAAAVLVLAASMLSACGASTPRRPYDNGEDNRLLMQQCQAAQQNQTPLPPQCPQPSPAPATRRRTVLVPDTQDVGAPLPPPVSVPVPALPRLPR